MTGGDMPSTALVPADDMAAIEALDPQAQEIAVTHMLTEARSWLAHAVEVSGPASIATFKAQMATVVEATKQLGLSKEIQLDAVEMVRRAERAVGLAIRKGQVEGTIAKRGDVGGSPAPGVRGGASGSPRGGDLDRPSQIIGADSGSELTPLYALADGISDEQFDDAIAEAKSEADLSRRNVVRKINQGTGRLSRDLRLGRIAELADKSWTSDKIAKDLGLTEGHIRKLARDASIEIPADRAMHGMHRRIDHNRIASNTVTALDGLVSGLQLLNIHEVDLTHADEWVTSLNASLRSLNRFRNDLIKEMTTTHDD